MENLPLLIDTVKHLYPKAVYPENKAQWDMGHRCLDFMSRALPLDKMILPSWLLLLLQQQVIGMRYDLSETQVKHLTEALRVGWDILSDLRLDSNNQTIGSIKKHKVANCGELSNVALNWMKNQNQSAYRTILAVQSPDLDVALDEHYFVLYTADGREMSFDKMMRNLNSPHIRIVDLWAQKCGQAKDVLNEYSRLFLCNKDVYAPAAFQDGYSVSLIQGFLTDGSDSYCIGQINETATGQKGIDFYKTPVVRPHVLYSDEEKSEIDAFIQGWRQENDPILSTGKQRER